jgi:hypothetical protein
MNDDGNTKWPALPPPDPDPDRDPDPTLERRRDTRAVVAIVLHALAALPAWILVVQQAASRGGGLASVEDGMGILICGSAVAVPTFVVGLITSIASLRPRAFAAALLAPASWGLALLFTS